MILTDTIKVIAPAAAAFMVGIAITPILTYYLYRYKAWKKRAGKIALNGEAATEFNRLHQTNEVRAPRMGGIVVWASVALTMIFITLLARFYPSAAALKLDFLSRNQTWVPLAAMLVGAFVGLLDDLLVIREDAKGMPLSLRLIVVFLLSTFIGWWFWDKLDVTTINIPFAEPLHLGILIIPVFILISLAIYASGVIDGIDGLSGGVFGAIFASYSVIAFAQSQTDLAAFSAAVVGGILAFLWFNIPPARFYLSDTGTMALTLCLAVVAFMTDSLGGGYGIAVLPIIGALLVATVVSVMIQLFWKKVFGRKLLRIAPLHHHLEAIGWPGYKVTMRYWVLSAVFAFAGVILALAAL